MHFNYNVSMFILPDCIVSCSFKIDFRIVCTILFSFTVYIKIELFIICLKVVFRTWLHWIIHICAVFISVRIIAFYNIDQSGYNILTWFLNRYRGVWIEMTDFKQRFCHINIWFFSFKTKSFYICKNIRGFSK